MKRKIYNVLSNMILGGDNPSRVKARGGISRELPFEVEVVAENLFVPWAIDISNEGKLYFTERSGAVRII